jgi:hypothetical protein
VKRLDRYLKFKKQVEQAERRTVKDQGALEQSLKQLKDLGFATLNDAKKELKRLTKEAADANKAYQKALDNFEIKWKGKLREQDKNGK